MGSYRKNPNFYLGKFHNVVAINSIRVGAASSQYKLADSSGNLYQGGVALSTSMTITSLASAAGTAVSISATDAGSSGAGPALTLAAGDAHTSGAGGKVDIDAGAGKGALAGGAVEITAGTSGATGTGGALTLLSGASAGASGTAGAVSIDTGAATGGTAGTITIGGSNASGVVFGASGGSAGIDVTIYGNTSGAYAQWDASDDALEMVGGAKLEFLGGSQNPIDMDSIAAFDTASSGSLGSVIKINLTGSETHTATTAAAIFKNYADGCTIDGNYELSAIIGFLKHKATMSGGSKSSLMSLHRHSSSTGTVDYGIRIFAADSKLTTMLYASGDMTYFFEAVADGNGGVTLGSDSMTVSPQSTAEDGYITLLVAGTDYQIPIYAA